MNREYDRWVYSRPASFEPDETVRRRFVRLLFKINILTYEKHKDIMMRYRP